MGKSQYILRGSFKAAMLKNMEKRSKLFQAIANDEELDLRLRGNEIHVYYRGGKILGIKTSSYQFDKKYASTTADKDLIKKEMKTIENEPEKYFSIVKVIMDQWFLKNDNSERDDQHHIASANKKFTPSNDLVVIDIEYTVSLLSNIYNEKSDKHSRFDIIAVDKTGQLYVLELKTGTQSIKNMDKHIFDFNNQVGNDEIGYIPENKEKRYITFTNEMNNVLQSLQEFFGYSKDIHIDTNKKPIFMFAYTDKEKDATVQKREYEDFKNKTKSRGVELIKIEKPGYYLKLNA